ncbi:hypothetical protein [Streptomyces albidochromogenes]|uniref:hypothetical protein n=1 Tax=Streptomyces albidochromogenes TaxID=329524 RepID=UPI003CD088A0
MNKGRFRVRAGVRDWLIAVGVAAALLVTGLSGHHSATGPGLPGYVLLVVGGLALAAGRRAPVAVLAATGLCAVGYQAAGFDVAAIAFLFAVYAAMRAGHRLITVVVSVAVLAALPLAALASSVHDTGEAFAQARGALHAGMAAASWWAPEMPEPARRIATSSTSRTSRVDLDGRLISFCGR